MNHFCILQAGPELPAGLFLWQMPPTSFYVRRFSGPGGAEQRPEWEQVDMSQTKVSPLLRCMCQVFHEFSLYHVQHVLTLWSTA